MAFFSNASETLEHAKAALSSNRHEEAARLVHRVLKKTPGNTEANLLLVDVYLAQSDVMRAKSTLMSLLDLDGNIPQVHYKLGCAHELADELEQAIACYREAIRLDPRHARAHNNLGCLFLRLGMSQDAVNEFTLASEAAPDLLEANINLTQCFLGSRDYAQAANQVQLTIQRHGEDAKLVNWLGESKFGLGEIQAAIELFQQSIKLDPAFPDPYANIGAAFQKTGRQAEALPWFIEALDLDGEHYDANINIGVCYQELGDFDKAIGHFRNALTTRPDSALANLNIGYTLEFMGKPDEAIACYDEAIRLDPDYVDAHVNRSLLFLLKGEYHSGFEEYEWRLRKPELAMLGKCLMYPQWDGGNLNGKRIILRTEQAFGDMIQFARYVPVVSQLGGVVLLDPLPELAGLLSYVPGVSEIVDLDTNDKPAADYCCPMMSLPRALKQRLQDIPCSVPYIKLPEHVIERWRARMRDDGRVRIGFVWASNPNNPIGRYKSMPLMEMLPLLQQGKALFFSLQKGPASTELGRLGLGANVVDLTEQIGSFVDTAGIIQNLDLVISVDTAVAHLAGALGKPVWLMLPAISDWRWLSDRDDSPWYPSMRIFRQRQLGNWRPVVQAIANKLAEIQAGGVAA